MADDVLINKAASIERCVAGAREEYAGDRQGFAKSFTRKHAAVLTPHHDDFLAFSRQMLLRDQA